MKNFLKPLALLFIATLLVLGCSKDKNENPIPANLEVNTFVWKGLNTYYLWKQDVPDLADSKKDSNDFNTFLASKGTAENLFQELLNKPISKFPKAQAVDRFSWIVDDYVALENLFKGITKSNGVDYQLSLLSNGTDVVGWVDYIIPNSDAAAKPIKRGDLFYAINGTTLTKDNYKSLLGLDTYTLSLADLINKTVTPNGRTVSLTKTELTENPILIKKVIPTGTHKVAYLMYNSFVFDFESDLNQAFTEFAAAGATDLVLDLRYNGGGRIDTAIRLAEMISGLSKNKVFAKIKWNNDVQTYFEASNPSSLVYNFTEVLGDAAQTPIKTLNLKTVYIVTSQSTYSASELVVNCLKPYINVVQIGDVTGGKNVGSRTLYDSKDFSDTNRNPNHKYAMQPLIIKLANSADFSAYENGLTPTISVKEDVANLGQLGDQNEPLLATALLQINAAARVKRPQQATKVFDYFADSNTMTPFGTEMYIKELPTGAERLLRRK